MSVVEATISIVRWDEFQHYRDRDPPWIKLYRDTLTSEPWMLGSDDTKLLLCSLVLIAARYKNAIPAKLELIKSMAYLRMSEPKIAEALAELVVLKFIEIQPLKESRSLLAKALLARCTSEELNRSELKSEQNTVQLALVSSNGNHKPDEVQIVFEHWQQTFGKQRAKLDPKRRLRIVTALKTYDLQSIKDSISGYKNSKFHNGENDKAEIYDDIELFLRTSKHIEKGIELHSQKRQVKYS